MQKLTQHLQRKGYRNMVLRGNFSIILILGNGRNTENKQIQSDAKSKSDKVRTLRAQIYSEIQILITYQPHMM
jgi:hypothetical protein